MRILITGGGGYIGSVLVPRLLAKGHHVTVLDTFAGGGTELAACCAYKTFVPVRGDARDEGMIKDLVPRADAVLPLAALVGAPICKQDPVTARTLNQEAVEMLAKHVSSSQIVVCATTNSGYGIGTAGKFCTEETPLNPISLYGVTKVAAEKAVLEAGGVSLRLATVFGMSPRLRIDLLVNDFTWRALTDRSVTLFEPHFKRNYIHIQDVAKAFEHAIAHYGCMRGQAFNVGLSTANLSKVELCERIKLQIPQFQYFEAPVGEDPDKRDYIVSNEKIERTGWAPDWSIDDGVAELIKGYRMIRNARYSNV